MQFLRKSIGLSFFCMFTSLVAMEDVSRNDQQCAQVVTSLKKTENSKLPTLEELKNPRIAATWLPIIRAYLSPDNQLASPFGKKFLEPLKMIDEGGQVKALAFRPDGKVLAVGVDVRANNGAIKIMDTQSYDLQYTIPESKLRDRVKSVNFKSDGSLISTTDLGHELSLWRASGKKYKYKYKTSLYHIIAINLAQNIFADVACNSEQKKIFIKDFDNNLLMDFSWVGGQNDSIKGLVFSPNGQVLAIFDYDGSIVVCNVKDKHILRMLHTNGYVSNLAFNDSGSLLVSGSTDSIKLWDVSSGTLIKVLQDRCNIKKGLDFAVTSMASCLGTDLVAIGYNNGLIELWDLANAELVVILKNPQNVIRNPTYPDVKYNMVNTIAFSWDGKNLAAGLEDKTVRLWSLQSLLEFKNFIKMLSSSTAHIKKCIVLHALFAYYDKHKKGIILQQDKPEAQEVIAVLKTLPLWLKKQLRENGYVFIGKKIEKLKAVK